MSSQGGTGTRFVLTPELINHVRTGSLIGSSLSLILSLFVCLSSLWIYSVPSTRKHLDRVSFRILIWSMAIEIPYTVCFILATRHPDLTQAGAGCGIVIYLLLATMGVANWLCTCIGVNLMLAITFNIDPIQAKLERGYLLSSFILGFGAPLVPAALGHFGPDPIYGVCYFTEGDKALRIRDFILDLYLWQLLSCLVAATSVCVVLITLYRQTRSTERALLSDPNLNLKFTPSELKEMSAKTDTLTTCSTTVQTSPPSLSVLRSSRFSNFWQTRVSPSRPRLQSRNSQTHRLEDKLTTIALKISVYPLTLLLINIIITAEDLSFSVRGGLFNRSEYNLYWLHNFLYGGRGIFFALLGIFVDPCLRLGFPAAFRATFPSFRHTPHMRPEPNPTETIGHWDESQSITDFLSTTEPYSLDYAKCAEKYIGGGGADQGYTLAVRGRRGSKGWRLFGVGSGSRKGNTHVEQDVKDLREMKDVMDMRETKQVQGDERLRISQESLRLEQDRKSHEGIETEGIETSDQQHQDPNADMLTTEITLSSQTSSVPTIRHPPAALIVPTPPSSGLTPNHLQPISAISCPRSTSIRSQNWLEPLSAAVLSRAESNHGLRRGSDPILSVAQRRRTELEKAAEELYRNTEMRL